MKKFKAKNEVIFIVMFVILALYVLSMAFMMGWGLMTSVKDPFEYRRNMTGFPEKLKFSNYLTAIKTVQIKIQTKDLEFKMVGVAQMYWNTIWYAGGCAFFSALIPCITAYLCAKFPYKFSGVVVGIVLVTMALPIVGSAPSQIQLTKTLGMYDTIWGMWLLNANFHQGVFFLVLYETFKQVPSAYREAAKIDGASNFQIMVRVMLPLVKNTFLTIFLLRLVAVWNEYQSAILFIPNKPTIAYGLYYYTFVEKVRGMDSVPMKLTGAFLICIPIIVLFALFQKRIMGNLSMGGLKG